MERETNDEREREREKKRECVYVTKREETDRQKRSKNNLFINSKRRGTKTETLQLLKRSATIYCLSFFVMKSE